MTPEEAVEAAGKLLLVGWRSQRAGKTTNFRFKMFRQGETALSPELIWAFCDPRRSQEWVDMVHEAKKGDPAAQASICEAGVAMLISSGKGPGPIQLKMYLMDMLLDQADRPLEKN
jgi:hypothetical protein